MIDVEESTFDLFLRYGLFFGAIFQLVCIGAAIFGPDISESHSKVGCEIQFHFSVKSNVNTFFFGNNIKSLFFH